MASDRLIALMDIVHVLPTDEDGIGPYPIDPNLVIPVGLKIGQSLDAETYDWFLEPSLG